MKKLNKLNKVVNFLITLFFAFLIFSFASCKSSELTFNPVEPLSLLDNESHFFITIPRDVDSNLITSLIQKNVEGIKKEQAELITNRIDVLYAGIVKSKKSASIQIAGDVNFPKIAVNKIFTRKNGFNEKKLEIQQGSEIKMCYSIYDYDGLELSFPSENIALLGRGTSEMLNIYHGKAFLTGYENNNAIEPSVYSFLNYNKDDEPAMKFYASRPQSFLTMLTGANLTLKLFYVRGKMITDPKFNEQYLMELEFEFKDPRMIPVAKGALSVAFGLTDSNVYLISPTHLIISNIKIGKEQLYNLLLI